MITGKTKVKLDEFELEIYSLIGNPIDRIGATYYFDLLHETFVRAVNHLALDSQCFHKELQDEDFDVKRSIIQSQESIAYPMIQTLYNSYFITIHSELESMWREVIQIYKKYYPEYSFPNKLSSQYFNSSSKNKAKRISFIDEVVRRHQILFTYNYIRNGIVHAKKSKVCDDFKILEDCIKNNNITDIEIEDVENGFIFLIKNVDFVKKYGNEVLSFFHAIIDNSVELRRKQPCS